MPSSKATKKLSPEQKKIAELEQQIADQSKTIGTFCLLLNHADKNVLKGNLERKIEESKDDDPIRNLIPKPPGQAGRRDGYKLADEVQLPPQRHARILVRLAVYVNYMCLFWSSFGQQIVRVIASHGLDPTKSFREQDKARMKVVVSKVF